MDPLAGSTWSTPGTVAGFAQSPPNATLVRFARAELRRGGKWALDVGCGAARNAVPLAQLGWSVLGVDLARPMIEAAAARTSLEGVSTQVRLALAPMHTLPAGTGSMDLIVAHGIWNLAQSGDEFRQAVREASRVARPGAALFVFTFSRGTLPAGAQTVAGETFVYTQFSGRRQCFLTRSQLIAELGDAGFTPDAAVPLTEHNAPRPGSIPTGNVPVIYEAAFRFGGRPAA
jgi:SAM-dependent methyltransferase